MPENPLTWKLVDEAAAELGASEAARLKWRQDGRGVPSAWRIKIAEELLSRQIGISFADFDRLQPNPGRIAA